MQNEFHILIVTADAGAFSLVEAGLSAESVRVDYALDNEEALERITRERPDLVLLDVARPRGRLSQLELRASERGLQMPFLIVGDRQATPADEVSGFSLTRRVSADLPGTSLDCPANAANPVVTAGARSARSPALAPC